MKVRCIKDYRYYVDGDIKKSTIGKGVLLGVEGRKVLNGLCETVITLDDNQFDRYFEIIDEEPEKDKCEFAKKQGYFKVDHPEHYNQGEMETIDVIEYVLSDINGKYAFALGNIIKYCNRANLKGGKEDLDKAKWYIERLIGGKE